MVKYLGYFRLDWGQEQTGHIRRLTTQLQRLYKLCDRVIPPFLVGV